MSKTYFTGQATRQEANRPPTSFPQEYISDSEIPGLDPSEERGQRTERQQRIYYYNQRGRLGLS